MAMLTSATGASGTPGTITGKLSAQAQAETQPQAKVSGLPQAIDGMSYDLPKVLPAVFRGDVRNLPKVPQNVRERPEVEEPFNAKQLMPEAQGPHKQEPNVPLAPMQAQFRTLPG
jgi:hypothetical protein